MSEGQEPQRLTIDDPVPPETLQQLAHISAAKADLCDRNAALDQEKVGILAALKRLDDQKIKLFHALNVERGLEPDTEVSINPRTGKIQLLRRRPDGSVEVVPPPKKEEPKAEPKPEEEHPEPVHTTS